MSEGIPHTAMAEANRLQAPQQRRSPRFGSPGVLRGNESKMAVAAKRTITVRKIAPRNTAALSADNKENTPRRSGNLRQTKVSSPGPGRRTPTVSSAVKKSQRASGRRETRQAAAPSPILASPAPDQRDQRDSVWTRKVRRSYSRLSDSSPHSPQRRETLFGFEKLSTPEVVRNPAEHSRTSLEVSGSFVSVLEAEEGCSGPDPNIPGVVVVKERRRRRKVLPIDTEELEVLAAQMNAEFREAEEFDLVVE